MTCIHDSCRFCMGSNKVLKVALGREESDEYKQNISELSNRIRGKIGLFFTKLPQQEVDHFGMQPILALLLSYGPLHHQHKYQETEGHGLCACAEGNVACLCSFSFVLLLSDLLETIFLSQSRSPKGSCIWHIAAQKVIHCH